MDWYIIGSVLHPQKKTFVPVVGVWFSDTKDLYQFYVVGSNDNFRKSPDANDYVVPVRYEIYLQFREVK